MMCYYLNVQFHGQKVKCSSSIYFTVNLWFSNVGLLLLLPQRQLDGEKNAYYQFRPTAKVNLIRKMFQFNTLR